MRADKAIQLDRLPGAARNELYDFYEFLVQKYAGSQKRQRAGKDAKAAFFDSVKKHTLTLPAGYSFDRDEIHER